MPIRNPLNPYPPEKDWKCGVRRLTITIPADDLALIEIVCPQAGTLTAIVLTLLKDLSDELRANDITTYNPEAVTGYLESVRRRSNIGTPRFRSQSNESRGTYVVRVDGETPASDDAAKGSSVKGKRKRSAERKT